VKTFLFLFQGFEEPTPQVMAAWQNWFATIGERFMDPGSPLRAGREVTPEGAVDLTADMAPATAYCLISAADLDEAVGLLDGCPIIDSARVYETAGM